MNLKFVQRCECINLIARERMCACQVFSCCLRVFVRKRNAQGGGGAGAADPRVIISCSHFKFYNIMFFCLHVGEAEE